jgi:hypothetical protein
MRILLGLILVAAAAAVPARGQLVTYGSPSPGGFLGILDSGGQLPYAGNLGFNLRIAGAANAFGGLLGVSANSASIPIGSAVLLIDPVTMTLITIPSPVTTLPIPLPPIASLAGLSAFVQCGLGDPALSGGFGLTNGVSMTIMSDRTPSRVFLSGQDFSGGVGQLSVMDLTTTPPAFRATGNLGFSGNISFNFSPKIAVAEGPSLAYALGNSTVNQFVRIFDISADPAGIVVWPMVGDIPVAQDIFSAVGWRDMEVLESNGLLFVTSGGGSSSNSIILEVFDVSGVPGMLPTAPVQTVTVSGAGAGRAALDLSPDGNRLAFVISADTSPALRLYDIVPGAVPPLVQSATFGFQSTYPGSDWPGDVHFSPDGNLVVVSGGNGRFSVVDVSHSPASVLLDGGTWSTIGTNSFHGSAVAIKDGALVLIAGDPSTSGGALYNLLDLNTTSASFATPITSFTTNPGGNISNHRLHARQSLVVAIDGTGATMDCQWVDIIDLSPPGASNYTAWRVQTPSTFSLTPSGLSSIPRDFDLF